MSGLVEKLVRVVARAFYSDESIVVLEGLLREKFMKDDEMGNAVNLQTKQVRKILAELHRDHVVCTETLNDKKQGGSSSMTYWYIDYKYFVDVIKYRLYKMNEFLKEREQLEMVRQIYLCSNSACGREYTALEAQRLITPGQYEFLCGHCSEPLLECNNNDALVQVQSLQKKFQSQMNKKEGHHDGITELLRKIGEHVSAGHVLPSNLPSENRAAGLGGESTKQAAAARGGNGAAGGGRKDGQGTAENAQSFLFPYGSQQQEIQINIDSGGDDIMLDRKRKLEADADARPKKQARALPEFLQGSTISGHLNATATMQEADEIVEEPVMSEPLSAMHSLDQNGMTEEQRQAAFKTAYMQELARYNTNTSSENIQVQVDTKDNDSDDGSDFDDEMDGVVWESCALGSDKSPKGSKDLGCVQVAVGGRIKPLEALTARDLDAMTNEEFTICYNHLRALSVH